jgi:hypothetical protein
MNHGNGASGRQAYGHAAYQPESGELVPLNAIGFDTGEQLR